MGLKNWYNSQNSVVQAAFVAGIFALAGGIIAGIFAIVNTELGKSGSQAGATAGSTHSTSGSSVPLGASPAPPPPTSSVARPAPTPSPSCEAKLHISKPTEDSIIPNGQNAAPVMGTACDLGGNSGWLFDFDPDDGYYYDDYTGATPTPAVQPSQHGAWDFPDSPIGDPGDQNKRYTITLVLASPSCAKHLRSEAPIDGDYKLKAFPPGCTVAQKVDVYVTNPPS